MALLDEVVAYLEDEGIGTFGTDIFIGSEPKTPVNVVTLYPTGGPKIGARTDRDTPTFQVRVRNTTYPNGWNKAWAIFKLLDVETDYLETMRGRCFAVQSQPMLIGRGANNEFLFTQNFRVHLVRP